MKPKYNFFKNSLYAINGLKELVKETSFKIELIFFVIFVIILLFLEVSLVKKLILFFSLIFVLIAEAINSAIEKVVDLVSLDFHPIAKKAKDIGASVVLLSIIFAVVVWGSILWKI